MTSSWQCDICDRHFSSSKNKIELARKLQTGSAYEYFSYQDMCTDCELYYKKMAEKRRRNHDTGSLLT